MTPIFYLDEDVAVALTRMLQELGHVATHTHDMLFEWTHRAGWQPFRP